MKTKLFLAVAIVASVLQVDAKVKPNAKAPQGGNMNYSLSVEPENIHPIMSGDQASTYIEGYTMSTLCSVDPNTYETVPSLAEKWEISKDGLTYTFFLRKDAFFHNGEPVTAEDVKFSFDAVKEPKHQALNILPYIEGITKIEPLDKHTVRFTVKEKYFKNLEVMCGGYVKVIPKSVYGDIEKSIKMQKEIVGTGPYILEKYNKGQNIVVKRFDKWFGRNIEDNKGTFNFDQVTFKFTKEDAVVVERFRKGELDFYEPKSVDGYLKADQELGKNSKAKAYKVENDMPKSYGFIGFNFRNPILAELETRLALAHLTNRAEMNKKFRNGMSDLATSPASVRSKQAADVKPIEFSPKKAQELLKKAGWSDSDKDGVLDRMKDGKKQEMKFSIIYANKDNEKYWTMLKEDAKKAGVEITLKFLEWNTFVKTIDDANMDLFSMGWGAGLVELDPKQIWHSTSKGKGGSNYGAYANAEVDKLIDEGRGELDPVKRGKIFKQVYTLIAKDVPYIFMFNNKFEFYVASNAMGRPTDTFKYALGYDSWWKKAE